MGRLLKRVALDFDWPYKQINNVSKVWISYMNPYQTFDCPYCGKTGYSKEVLDYLNSIQWFKDRYPLNLNEREVEELVKGKLFVLTMPRCNTWNGH